MVKAMNSNGGVNYGFFRRNPQLSWDESVRIMENLATFEEVTLDSFCEADDGDAVTGGRHLSGLLMKLRQSDVIYVPNLMALGRDIGDLIHALNLIKLSGAKIRVFGMSDHMLDWMIDVWSAFYKFNMRSVKDGL